MVDLRLVEMMAKRISTVVVVDVLERPCQAGIDDPGLVGGQVAIALAPLVHHATLDEGPIPGRPDLRPRRAPWIRRW